MKDPSNLEEVARLQPDFLGFIFYPPSPRYVGEEPDPALFEVPAGIPRVGVFVNEEPGKILDLLHKGRIDLVQLHGKELPDYCERLQSEGVKLIKALSPDQLGDLSLLDAFGASVDYLLLDTPTPAYGGSGQKFDWSLLHGQSLPRPFFLSGGIGPDDAGAIQALDVPGVFALDLNSRFEREPGLKDAAKLETFFQHLRQENR